MIDIFAAPPPWTIGALFAGIGGLDLGVEVAGGEVVWQVEIDDYCRAVLAKHWPAVDRSITDVRTASASNLRRVATIIGGFPCTDVSGAGLGAGLGTEDSPSDRSGLWFEMRRIIAELRPRAVIVENVASGKKRWLCRVRADLHALGYRTRAVQISAAECGAPHLRERIFVLALANADGMRGLQSEGGKPEQWGRASDGRQGIVAHPGSSGQKRSEAAQGGQSDFDRGDIGPVADTNAGGWRERARSCGDEAGLAGPANSGCVADANEPGLEGRCEPKCGCTDERTSGAGNTARSDNKNAGGALAAMGRDPARLSAGLDAHRWPAARGAEQHEGEPPRTVQGRQEHRRARLKALGNAVVPHQARAAALMLREWAAQEGMPL